MKNSFDLLPWDRIDMRAGMTTAMQSLSATGPSFVCACSKHRRWLGAADDRGPTGIAACSDSAIAPGSGTKERRSSGVCMRLVVERNIKLCSFAYARNELVKYFELSRRGSRRQISPQQELSHEPCRCERAEKTIELKLAGRVVVTDANEIAIVDFKSAEDNQLEERNCLARRRPEKLHRRRMIEPLGE